MRRLEHIKPRVNNESDRMSWNLYKFAKRHGVNKDNMSKLEWEILADMYAVNMYGHEKVLDTLFKTAKIAQMIYDDIDTDQIRDRMVEIQIRQIKNR